MYWFCIFLTIFFLGQVGFSATTLVVFNTNIQYSLFKPAPLATLEAMESDLLVSALSPRTIAPGHSLLTGKVSSSYDFKSTEKSYSINGDIYSNGQTTQLSGNQTTLLSDGKTISLLKKPITLDIDFSYRLSLGKRVEGSFDFGSTPDLKSLLMKLNLKWFLSRSKLDLFQLSVRPFFGFNTALGLHGGLGIPMEIRFHEKFRLGFIPQVTVGMGVFSPPTSASFLSISNFSFRYNFELPHSSIIRYLPEPFVNFFIEYAGKLVAAPEATFLPSTQYSAAINLGLEFTFWKNFQLAVAANVRLFELPIKLGGSLGLAVRL